MISGAVRVYVNNQTWKEDVKELMEKANTTFILVNDRTSCIWEIEQSSSLLGKTIFIIDDKRKYINVCLSLNNIANLPEIPDYYKDTEHLILRYEKTIGFIFEPFENSSESYARLLRIKTAT